ncbi:MAG TPA: hypothetical protein DGT23_08925 [Micromonosporaceae bacterium]|nr:hypothetical protein [Micromonosporaceae bacterium]
MKAKADRGSGPVEFAVLGLPLLIITFIVVQAAFVFYARSTALAAATQGANAARAYNASAGAGPTKANDFLTRVGGGLRNPSITMTSTGTEVTMTVTGQAQTIIPGLTFAVSQSASGPIERFTS